MGSTSEAAAGITALGIIGIIISLAIAVAAIVAYLMAISMFIDAIKAKGYHRNRGAGILWFLGILLTPVVVGLYAAALPDRQLRDALAKNSDDTKAPPSNAVFAKPQPPKQAYVQQKPAVNPTPGAQQQPIVNPGFAGQQPIVNPGFAGQQPIVNPALGAQQQPIVNPGFAGQQPIINPGFATKQPVQGSFSAQNAVSVGANPAQGVSANAIPLQNVNVSAVPLPEDGLAGRAADTTIPRG